MKDRVLIVDDNESNRGILSKILSVEYQVTELGESSKLMHYVDVYQDEIAVILVDLIMSQDDDCELLKTIAQRKWHEEIPIMVIVGNHSVELEKKLFEYGISDSIRKPFDANLILLKIRHMVSLYQYKNKLKKTVEKQHEQLEMQNKMLRMQTEYLKKSNENITALLGTLVEYRDLESGEHVSRVKRYTEILANELSQRFPQYGLSEEDIKLIVAASPLHDIGKITIPNEILLKPDKLTDEEYERMKSHTLSGCEVIENIEDTWSDEYKRISMEICHYHHERYDGKGYPEGLVGEEIPISAQLVSVADVYDALVNERVYKDAIPKDRAYRMIVYGECGTFSPYLIECFSSCREEMESVQ